MSDLHRIGASALSAYRTALATIGNNVANAQTPGYARRATIHSEIAPTGSAALPGFNGARVTAIARGAELHVANAARVAEAASRQADVRGGLLTRIDEALDNGGEGAGVALTALFNAADRLAADPDNAALQSGFLGSIDTLGETLRQTATGLDAIATSATASLSTNVDATNADLLALATINAKLAVARSGSASRAGLEDDRDRLLASISGRIGVEVTLADNGSAKITLDNAPWFALVDGGQAAQLALDPDAPDHPALTASSDAGTEPVVLRSGAIAGSIDGLATLARRSADLDSVARDIATLLNDWSAAGFTATGTSGAPIVAATNAADFAALPTDRRDLPLRSADGTRNGNLLALAGIRDSSAVEQRWSDIVATNAQLTASARSAADLAARLAEASAARVDAQTGVDLDREAAELLRYQQAYGAAARILMVSNETVDTILGLS